MTFLIFFFTHHFLTIDLVIKAQANRNYFKIKRCNRTPRLCPCQMTSLNPYGNSFVYRMWATRSSPHKYIDRGPHGAAAKYVFRTVRHGPTIDRFTIKSDPVSTHFKVYLRIVVTRQCRDSFGIRPVVENTSLRSISLIREMRCRRFRRIGFWRLIRF